MKSLFSPPKANRAALAGGVALGVLAWGAQASAASPDEEARIARLEAAVTSLQAQVQAQSGLAAENATLKAQVDRLQSRVGDLAAIPSGGATTILSSAQPTAASSGNAPVVTSTFANGEPGFATADGRFSLNFYALVQLDTAVYDQDKAGPIVSDFRRSGPALGFSAANVDFAHARKLKNGDEFRRARFGVSGNAFQDFQYRVLFDFGGSGLENAGQLYEAWAQYSGFKPFKLRVGAFAPQESLADQDSTAAQPLLDRPASADIGRNFAAGDTRTAAQLFATGDHYLASVAVTGRNVGVINTGAPTGVAQTYGDPLAVVGRIAATPFYGAEWRIHVGGHASYLARPADLSGPAQAGSSPLSRRSVTFSDQAELRVDGTRLINTGNIDAKHADNEGAEFAAQWRGFLLQSEYDYFHVGRNAAGVTDPHFQGYYVEGSWVLTGEARKYNAGTAAFDAPPVPHPLGSGGGLGVVEIALRYSDMNLNYHAGAVGSAPAADAIRGGELQTWTAGINWYLNPYIRLALEGQHIKIDRLSPDAVIYGTPIGAQIGQSYNAVALRSQFGF